MTAGMTFKDNDCHDFDYSLEYAMVPEDWVEGSESLSVQSHHGEWGTCGGSVQSALQSFDLRFTDEDHHVASLRVDAGTTGCLQLSLTDDTLAPYDASMTWVNLRDFSTIGTARLSRASAAAAKATATRPSGQGPGHASGCSHGGGAFVALIAPVMLLVRRRGRRGSSS